MTMKQHILAATLGTAVTALSSAANLSVLVSSGTGLSNFDTAVGVASRNDVSISGLASGDSLVGIDYRPATGVTYGISSNSNIYTINTVTGAASQLGGTLSPTFNGSTFGFDYNPAFMGGQFARVISNLDNNRVIDGNAGGYLGTVEKTAVFYAMGDPNAGVNPDINHIAYNNSVFGSTTTQQFGIDTDLDILTTVANNAGTLATIGGLGVDASDLGGFDVDGASGRGFAAFQDVGGLTSTIYEIDFGTGAATSLFSFTGGAVGLTTVPEPSSTLLISLAGLGLIGRRKR